MQNIAIRVPERVTSEELRSGLDHLILRHNGVISFSGAALPSRFGPIEIKMYEIPTRGTITTWTNEKNQVEVNIKAPLSAKIICSAFVNCTGFDEQSPVYLRLVENLSLLERYHNI